MQYWSHRLNFSTCLWRLSWSHLFKSSLSGIVRSHILDIIPFPIWLENIPSHSNIMYELFKWASPQQGRGTQRGGTDSPQWTCGPLMTGTFFKTRIMGPDQHSSFAIRAGNDFRNVLIITLEGPHYGLLYVESAYYCHIESIKTLSKTGVTHCEL